ncbi:MAG: hypothetical protein HY749_08350 [Gammaproteobacteria bacterium]|nr:hypothetical protein [Gammaproteobacteria bacterium]MBI5615243.1 hypothetical protein [Gammaproteobacteria bacterium]
MYNTYSAGAKGEPGRGLARAWFKLRSEGPGWIWRRLQSEYVLPTTKPGRALHKALRGALGVVLAPRRLLRAAGAAAIADRDTLYAFYDLKVQPITYDVVWFLAAADLERRRQNLAGVHLVIVPGPDDVVRTEDAAYVQAIDAEARRWRITNILAGCHTLLPAGRGLTVAATRTAAGVLRDAAGDRVFPRPYELGLPTAHHPGECLKAAAARNADVTVLRAGVQALRYVDQWIAAHAAGRRLVVVTLRDYHYNAARNSNLDAWTTFATGLDPARWLPVFVPDTERCLEEVAATIGGFPVFREACWNVGLRMALYERAYLNVGVNNGPLGLCWLNGATRYITFKMIEPSVAQTTREYLEWCGYEIGASLPCAGPAQKWVWEDDTAAVIGREFAHMVERIEHGGA